MAFQFPPSPSVDQTFTPVAGTTYRWSGTAWYLLAGPGSFITTTEADVRYVNIDEAQNTTNRIINGKFAIDQRNAGAAVVLSATNAYCPDRWFNLATDAVGQFSAQRVPDGVIPGSFVFTNGVNVANLAPAAGAAYLVLHVVEGINTADFHWGSSAASPITIAFEIQSNVTGTFSFRLSNSAGTRSYVAPFTVNVVNAIEQKVFTIPGDTQGVWLTDNGKGLEFCIPLCVGTNFVGSQANTWVNGNFTSLAGQTNFMATVGNRLYLRNVRLYKGAVDFGPDRRLYAEELALCQRYYEKSYQQDVVPGTATRGNSTMFNQPKAASSSMFTPSQSFKVVKRASPTMTIYTPDFAGSNPQNLEAGGAFTGSTIFNASDGAFSVSCTTPAGSAQSSICAYHWTASAEL